MRYKITFMSFATLIIAICYNNLLAQEGSLAEKFKRELSPSHSRSAETVSRGTSKGVGGTTRPPTIKVNGESRPSTTIHLEFMFNSVELTPEAVQVLAELGKALQDNELNGFIYTIEGHTDSIGSDAYNLELSRRRAQTVANHLVKTFALEQRQFNVEPFGKRKPVAPNDTEEGRAQNRRVVIVNTLKRYEAHRVDLPKIAIKVKYSKAGGEGELTDGETLSQRDNYAIELMPQTSAHVYVFQVDALGSIETLFPNPKYSQSSNLVEPGKLYRIPTFGSWLFLDDNKGKEHIVVVAQKGELKDPVKICRAVVDSRQTMVASADTSQIAPKNTGGTKGAGGIRRQQARQEEVKPTSKQHNDLDSSDLAKVFRWILSFDHQ